MTAETMTTTERALAAWREHKAAQEAERERRERRDAEIRRDRFAAEAATAIEAHGWLFNVAGATWLEDPGNTVCTDDGLVFRFRQTSRGPQIQLVWLCDDCGAPAVPDRYRTPIDIEGWEDLGRELEVRAQSDVVRCESCWDRAHDAWLAEQDGPAPADPTPPKGPEIRPARDGWVYLPARQQWINGATIESVSSDASGESDALYITYLPINPATDNDEYVRDEHDVRALTRWLEDWS